MKNNLLMNFSVDRGNVRILVEKEFAAPLALVWRSWIDSTLLDQWWAPKPWRAKTKSMDFREDFTGSMHNLDQLLHGLSV